MTGNYTGTKGIIATILIFIFCGVSFALTVTSLTKDANDKYEYAEDGGIIFTEAKCLVGSIFHKDSFMLSADDIEIDKSSFFGKKKTVYPYHTIKEITFSNAFNGYKVVINYPGSFFGTDSTTLYFNQKDTFDLLEDDIKDYSKNRCIITESF